MVKVELGLGLATVRVCWGYGYPRIRVNIGLRLYPGYDEILLGSEIDYVDGLIKVRDKLGLGLGLVSSQKSVNICRRT